MKYLIDTSLLVHAERENFALDLWLAPDDEIFICGATVAEFMAGQPLNDEGKRKRWREFWESLDLPVKSLNARVCRQAGALILLARSRGKTVPLGDGFHAAVAELDGLRVLTTDKQHFADMGVATLNPLSEPPRPPAA
ncbi:MAG: type II toxin-antitoxin system VapC family toxin [Verrucomicrobia bacterium]|nr:type II toxin-antitoxin system VapC family toxin [Verrucomicrobiota bacterium]MDE3100266.1 type II toxin-antitoxin system VapC family toxin [Verrucomicrobiota bacterium]